MTSTADLPEPDYPFPPRYWWTRRIAVGFAVLLLLLLAVRLVWGYAAQRQLTRAIQAIQARGEPIWPADFNRSNDVPDSHNAAHHLRQAMNAINQKIESPSDSNLEFPNYLPMPPEWLSMARKSIAANQTALHHARAARQFDTADWGVSYTTPVVGTLLRHLNNARTLANILVDAAVYEHIEGNDAAALDYLLDLFHEADMIGQQPSVISHLVANGIDSLGVSRLSMIAPGLRLDEGPTPARREQVQQLIARLLSDDPVARMRHSLLAERMGLVDLVEWRSAHSTLLRPMQQLGLIDGLRVQESVIAASTQPTYALARQVMIPAPAYTNQKNELATMILWQYGSTEGVVEMNHRAMVNLRTCAVSLAARMYQLDHGRWPIRLDELVPHYLPTVPIDPFSPTGAPMGYLRANGGVRPIVYSVGPDGIDDTTEQTEFPARPLYDRTDTKDQWRDLSRFAGPAPTTDESE